MIATKLFGKEEELHIPAFVVDSRVMVKEGVHSFGIQFDGLKGKIIHPLDYNGCVGVKFDNGYYRNIETKYLNSL